MSTGHTPESREARHGNKMIEVKVRFWTNDLAPKANTVIPGHAWTAGVVRLKPNPAHSISPSAPLPFNSLLELPVAIERLLIREGIVLHIGARMTKYIKK